MYFNDVIAGIGAQLMSPMGEPVTLADGSLSVWIFDALGTSVEPPWPDTGMTLRVSDQPSPVAYFLAASALSVNENDVLTARNGTEYRVVRKYPVNAASLVQCDLALVIDPIAAADTANRWQ